MEHYKIINANSENWLIEDVNKLISEGYIPIGRSFEMFRCYYQTLLHKSAIGKANSIIDARRVKYIIVADGSAGLLSKQVNKLIEDGYIPTGRMHMEGESYKQSMIHSSLLSSLEIFTTKVIIEDSTGSYKSK